MFILSHYLVQERSKEGQGFTKINEVFGLLQAQCVGNTPNLQSM
jgi:hypothetical protein